MNAGGGIRIEALQKENYDTWKIQIEALLIKNDAWNYVNGKIVKPEPAVDNAASIAATNAWIAADNKAKSDLILSISPSELKQVKGCNTSREVWLKLEGIYQSKGPAREATLLKQLMLQKMQEGEDVREHTRRFFDAVDKLHEMEIDINQDLLAIMLLYSLPTSFENFRCAIESRDELPSPETLRIKIAEESDARKNVEHHDAVPNAMMAVKFAQKKQYKKKKIDVKSKFDQKPFKYRCHKCREIGHKAIDCKQKGEEANKTDNACFSASPESNGFNVSAKINGANDKKWCIDSGCSSHLCQDSSDLVKIETNERGKLNLANSAYTEIKAKGVAALVADVNGVNKTVRLTDVLHVPDLRTSLVSVGRITDKGFTVRFNAKTAEVVDRSGNVVLLADRIDGLYYVRRGRMDECRRAENVKKRTLMEWHVLLGHMNLADLREAAKNEIIKGLVIDDTKEVLKCEICLQGKMTRPPFPKESKRRTNIGDIIHSDVCGPMRVFSNGKARYFVTFIDDSTRWCEVRFLSQKGDVLKEFENFKALMETQYGKRVKCLQSDNGREYSNTKFDEFLKTQGIQRRLTAAYNPEQNGVAERKNRSLVETARCLLIQSGLPSSFWAEAVHTANYIRNRCPTSKLDGRTPYEALFGMAPDVKDLKKFGEKVYCLDRSQNKGKFEPRSRNGVFLGYAQESKAYRIWMPEERKVQVTRDVKFVNISPSTLGNNSEEFYSKEFSEEKSDLAHDTEIDSSNVDHQLDINLYHGINDNPENHDVAEDGFENLPERLRDDVSPDPLQQDVIGQRQKRAPGRPRKILTGKPGRPRKECRTVPVLDEVADYAMLIEVPLKQAMTSPESFEWMRAMSAELKSVLKNDTWDIVDRPSNREVIGSRVVLRDKYGQDGRLERRKARIVARGFSQRPGTDFHETFAPVARLKSIRLTVAFAAHRGMHTRQFDVTTAYLNGILEEEVYMEAPDFMEEILVHIIQEKRGSQDVVKKARKMLEDLSSGDKVCLMRKALYGLRQAGRVWHKRLDHELRDFGFIPSEADPCVYLKGKEDSLFVVVVYVDDLIVMSQNLRDIEKLREHLKRSFELKDLGDLKHCLGMDFERRDGSIRISQTGYIKDILRKFGMLECNPVSTPLDVGVRLSKTDPWMERDGEKPPYRELVGALMYLSVITRPDISHAASLLSQFSNCFGVKHWNAAKRVLRYLKGSAELGITFGSRQSKLTGYVDADWGGDLDDRRSFTGYVFTWNGAVISWESKKQRTVALSSTESEYMALGEAAKEAVYLQRFLSEIGVDDVKPVKLFNDNMGAQKLAGNPIFHGRTKHIDIRHHFVRDLLESRRIELGHVSTGEMPADVLTKALPKPKHWKCLDLLGFISL